MQARLKIMTVLATMAAMFAMLPALSAVAAEPLEDGSYTVVAGDERLALQVTDGTPLVAVTPGVEWFFDYDDEDRVLDEFDVVVDGVAYEVEIGEDGTAFATPHDDDFVPTPPAPDVSLAVEEPELEEDEGEELEEEELEEEPEADEDAAPGELVSAVAKCAPNGRTAREAGMPNHGAFVSAVAKGEVLTITVDETDFVIDPSAGADAVCATIADALAAGEAAAEAAVESDSDAEDAPRGSGNGKDRDGAPGKSGEAPGKAKKGAEG